MPESEWMEEEVYQVDYIADEISFGGMDYQFESANTWEPIENLNESIMGYVAAWREERERELEAKKHGLRTEKKTFDSHEGKIIEMLQKFRDQTKEDIIGTSIDRKDRNPTTNNKNKRTKTLANQQNSIEKKPSKNQVENIQISPSELPESRGLPISPAKGQRNIAKFTHKNAYSTVWSPIISIPPGVGQERETVQMKDAEVVTPKNWSFPRASDKAKGKGLEDKEQVGILEVEETVDKIDKITGTVTVKGYKYLCVETSKGPALIAKTRARRQFPEQLADYLLKVIEKNRLRWGQG